MAEQVRSTEEVETFVAEVQAKIAGPRTTFADMQAAMMQAPPATPGQIAAAEKAAWAKAQATSEKIAVRMTRPFAERAAAFVAGLQGLTERYGIVALAHDEYSGSITLADCDAPPTGQYEEGGLYDATHCWVSWQDARTDEQAQAQAERARLLVEVRGMEDELAAPAIVDAAGAASQRKLIADTWARIRALEKIDRDGVVTPSKSRNT